MNKEIEQEIIEKYNIGQSMNEIAKEYKTYATTIKRILEKNGIKLRHDSASKGTLLVNDGEKLIEWAKAQNRLVTKEELAKIAGTKRLSPSYFIKYPELGQYVKVETQGELSEYYNKLYDWLKENDIPYKPNDRTRMKVSVDALLLKEYSNIAIQISIKPINISKKKYDENMQLKSLRAKEKGLEIIFLNKEDFENLDNLKLILDELIINNKDELNENRINNEELIEDKNKETITINTDELNKKYKLAKKYYYGVTEEQDFENAFTILSELVDKYNDGDSRLLLAEMYYLGYYVEEDKDKSFEIFHELLQYDSVGDKEWFFNEVMLFSIMEYLVELNCITEEVANECLSMNLDYNYQIIKILKKAFKKSLSNAAFNVKIKILKYLQKYVIKFYNDGTFKQTFSEQILDEFLKYITFYDPAFISKIDKKDYIKLDEKHNIISENQKYIVIGDVTNSVLNYKKILSDLFSYPARQLDKYYKNLIICETTLNTLSSILYKTLLANQLDFANELIQLSNSSNIEYCQEIIDSVIKSLRYNKKIISSSQIRILLKWTNQRKYIDFFVEVIINNIKADNLHDISEIFELLYTNDTKFFNEIFNLVILNIKNNGRKLSKAQIDLFNKWTKYTDNENFNNFAISHKTKYLTEEQISYIQGIIADIIKNENDIINCLKVISEKEHKYLIVKLIVESLNNDKATIPVSKCLFRILNTKNIRENITYYKFLNDDEFINILINLINDNSSVDNNAISVFLLIVNEYLKRGNTDKAIKLIKTIIDAKPIFADNFIKELITSLGSKKFPKYVLEVIEYANSKKIYINNEEKSYKELYKKINEANLLKNDNTINLTDYILNIDSKTSDENLEIINEKVYKMLKQKNSENEFDFEKVIEYIIQNKSLFLRKTTCNKFNYAEWFFEGIKRIKSEEKLKKLIENPIIVEDLLNNLVNYDDRYYYLKYKEYDYYHGGVDLKRYLVDILVMKYYNDEISKLVYKIAKNAKIELKNEKEMIEECYNNENYNSLENIEKLDNSLIDLLKDPINDIYNYGDLPYCTFYHPNNIYLLFITKICEKKYYNYASNIIEKYIKVENYEAVDVILYELYNVYGIEMLKNILYSNNELKKLYFINEEYKVKLITKISAYISKEDTIIMLDFLINSTNNETYKYELIKKILSSTNYREIITLQEFEFINSIIITLNTESYKHELIHKLELLSKKKNFDINK